MARTSKSYGVSRPSKKNSKVLDYSYGETPKVVEPVVKNGQNDVDDEREDNDEDDLIVGSRTSTKTKRQKDDDFMERVQEREAKRLANSKYLGYNDFTNGGNNTTTTSEKDSIKTWNRFIGYVLIRIVSPFILIGHCLFMGYNLWQVYKFNFGHEDLTKQFIMPIVVGVISLHSVIVHFINKSLFKDNYYKKRV